MNIIIVILLEKYMMIMEICPIIAGRLSRTIIAHS